MSHIFIPEVLWVILIRHKIYYIKRCYAYDILYDHKKGIIFFIANGAMNLYIGLECLYTLYMRLIYNDKGFLYVGISV